MPRLPVATLTIDVILSWAAAHRERTGQWPTTRSGPIAEAPGRTWASLNVALCRGSLGLPGELSLAALLALRVGKSPGQREPLRVEQIEGWVRSHQRRCGSWPNTRSGEVVDAPGETWRAIDKALCQGARGLPGGDSLVRLVGRLKGGRCNREARGRRVSPEGIRGKGASIDPLRYG
jgi:hypothetical protein